VALTPACTGLSRPAGYGREVEIGVLGPLEVRDGAGRPVTVAGAKQCALLAALALHVPDPVSSDRLLDWLWAGERLADPANALQAKVSSLRRRLRAATDGAVVEAAPPGYRLAVDPDRVDWVRFERGVAAGREALERQDCDRAVALLDAALRLWRGDPLPELEDTAAGAQAATRWADARLAALEDRADAELRRGRHAAALAALEDLARQHPLRESTTALLLLALYRAGRQADAVDAYQQAASRLRDELGLDPGPELRGRYEAVLRQDASLEVSASRVTTGGTPPARQTSGLPAPATAFVGRHGDPERILALLAASGLVTLTGPGGVGKTRLAVEAARLAEAGVAAGEVRYVALAEVAHPAEVPLRLASALGVVDESGGEAASRGPALTAVLREALRERELLVVLDNCEHLVEAVADLVPDLLDAAARLRVLVTSRRPLGLEQETVWSVPSLGVPLEDADLGALEELDRYDAVALFVDRARAADRHFALGPDNAAAVAEVCRRLDGIPLALELAAARVRSVDVADLARVLADRLSVLDGTGPRSRRRTLGDTVTWSWELLEPDEREALARLSVFAGGWDLAAARAVLGDDALDLTARLVDHSLVTVRTAGTGRRYGMLEIVREFGAERLEGSGAADEARDRHAAYFAAVAADCAPRLRTGEQLDAAAALAEDEANLRAALANCRDGGALGLGLRMAVALAWWWYLRGRRAEACGWLDAFTSPAADGDAVPAAMATLWSAFLSLDTVRGDEAWRRIAGRTGVVVAHGRSEEAVLALSLASVVADTAGEVDGAAALRAQAREIAAGAGDRVGGATLDLLDGMTAAVRGDQAGAASTFTRARDGFAAVGDRWGEVQCLNSLMVLAEGGGDLERMDELGRRALLLAGELGLPEMQGVLRLRIASAAIGRGDLGRAEEDVAAVRESVRRTGSTVVAAMADLTEAALAQQRGDLDRTGACLVRALGVYERLGNAPGQATTLLRLADLRRAQGDLAGAREAATEALRHAEASRDPTLVTTAREAVEAVDSQLPA
jgi:predicted ATPase/DNA-binding SARP family transcriptional activator